MVCYDVDVVRVVSAVSVIVLALGCSDGESPSGGGDDLFSPAVFADPPIEFGPQVRWWWPGGAVEDATLLEQLSQFAELGYSAVEIQPFMSAVTNADLSNDSRIRTVGESSFMDRLRTAACGAGDLGLFWDLTLGSGWSTGGVSIDQDGARQLIAAELTLVGPASYQGPLPAAEPPAWIDATNNVLPAIAGFDENAAVVAVLAAEVLEEPASSPVILGDVVDVGSSVAGDTLSWEVPDGTHRVFAIYENRTLHFPVGNAYPGPIEAARIIDHLDRRGVEAFIDREFGAWIDAVADCSPRAVFVDSFELVGELPWTTAFGAQFESALGYDITPMLPFLFLAGGESEYATLAGAGPPRYQAVGQRGLRAREDYEAFRGALFVEELIVPLRAWLQDRDIEFRLQAHGGYADVLDAYGMADVPESEGLYGGGSYDFLRLAASAAHVGGKRFVSSETFPTVGALELTEDEARLLMGRAFSAGINRLMVHGHAYPYLHQDGQRWFPFHPLEESAFKTGPLDLTFDIHPDAEIWAALPSLNRMAARLSYAMSRGAAAAEVAWLYPEWEAESFVNFSAESVEPRAFESEISIALRRAGFSYARLSRSALAASTSDGGELRAGQASFRALVIENVDVTDPEVLRAALDAADAGVAVVWMGSIPERAEGLVDAISRDAMVAALADRVQSEIRKVSSADGIPAAITEAGVLPALSPLSSDGLRMSVAHRQVVGGDLYFLFNESYQQQTHQFRIGGEFAEARLLDPDTGQALETNLDGDVLTLTLPGARGVVLWLAR